MHLTCQYCKESFENPRYSKCCSSSCRSKLKYREGLTSGAEWALKLKSSSSSNKTKRRRKLDLVTLKGGQCIDCGYNRCISALEFHHVSGKKEATISQLLKSYSSDIYEEIEKCVLLCGNCHRKAHSFCQMERDDYQVKAKTFLYRLAGNKCANCPESNPDTFEFHHINPKDKKFHLSRGIASRWNIHILSEEARKCSLLCTNCHRETHSNFDIKLTPIKVESVDIESFLFKNGYDRICRFCSEIFKTTQASQYLCGDVCQEEYSKLNLTGEYVSTCEVCNSTFKTSNPSIAAKCSKCRCSSKYLVFSDGEFQETKEFGRMKEFYKKCNYNLEKTGKEFDCTGNSIKKMFKKHCAQEWITWELNKKESLLVRCKVCLFEMRKYDKKGDKQTYCSESCRVSDKKYHYNFEEIAMLMQKYNNVVSKVARELKVSRKGLTKWLQNRKFQE